MKLLLFALLVPSIAALADVPAIANSESPNGKLHAVMDIDRDPKLKPAWKGDSFPQIEITEKATGKILAKVAYFGAVGDDLRPLREHVVITWRPDSKALAVRIDDRFYSMSQILALNKESKFVSVSIPNYKELTGFPDPDRKHLRPRGRASAMGWDKEGRLIYDVFFSPLPSFRGRDPLHHRVLLEVSAKGMKRVGKLDPKKKLEAKKG